MSAVAQERRPRAWQEKLWGEVTGAVNEQQAGKGHRDETGGYSDKMGEGCRERPDTRQKRGLGELVVTRRGISSKLGEPGRRCRWSGCKTEWQVGCAEGATVTGRGVH